MSLLPTRYSIWGAAHDNAKGQEVGHSQSQATCVVAPEAPSVKLCLWPNTNVDERQITWDTHGLSMNSDVWEFWCLLCDSVAAYLIWRSSHPYWASYFPPSEHCRHSSPTYLLWATRQPHTCEVGYVFQSFHRAVNIYHKYQAIYGESNTKYEYYMPIYSYYHSIEQS